MSRHYFRTTYEEQPVLVVLGWDRPLGYFFMTIEQPIESLGPDVQCRDEAYLYSNLFEQNPFGNDLPYYRGELERIGITVPDGMFEQALLDKQNNVGNRDVIHQADGTFVDVPFSMQPLEP